MVKLSVGKRSFLLFLLCLNSYFVIYIYVLYDICFFLILMFFLPLMNLSELLVRLNDMVSISTKRLDEIDDKGAFSSDDEIGWFFTYVYLNFNNSKSCATIRHYRPSVSYTTR